MKKKHVNIVKTVKTLMTADNLLAAGQQNTHTGIAIIQMFS